MQTTEDLKKFVREGLEHYVENRNKDLAWDSIKDRIEAIGFLDLVRDALFEAIDQFKSLNEGEDGPPLIDKIMRQSLLDTIGIEPTIVDTPSNRAGSTDLSCSSLPD